MIFLLCMLAELAFGNMVIAYEPPKDAAHCTLLLMRIYFDKGVPKFIQSWDGRGGAQAKTCTMPNCSGAEDNELIQLNLPTWPRICTQQADLPACQRDPE